MSGHTKIKINQLKKNGFTGFEDISVYLEPSNASKDSFQNCMKRLYSLSKYLHLLEYQTQENGMR